MIHKSNKVKYFITTIWVVFFCLSLYMYFFDNEFLKAKLAGVFGSSIMLGYVIYLLIGCLRGFTLIPITYFILIGIIFFPPWPLYFLTMIGVIVSSLCIYYFSEYLNFDEYFESKHPKQIKNIKNILVKNELLIVTSWSFFPFLPIDLICYVCGTLEVDIRKFLFGVFLGESVACALYIFLGKEILAYIA